MNAKIITPFQRYQANERDVALATLAKDATSMVVGNAVAIESYETREGHTRLWVERMEEEDSGTTLRWEGTMEEWQAALRGALALRG